MGRVDNGKAGPPLHEPPDSLEARVEELEEAFDGLLNMVVVMFSDLELLSRNLPANGSIETMENAVIEKAEAHARLINNLSGLRDSLGLEDIYDDDDDDEEDDDDDFFGEAGR